MAGKDNLIPMNQRTEEEQREIASKGGKASVEARRRKKTMRENLEILLALPLQGGKSADIEKAKDLKSFSNANMTVEQALIMAQIKKAAKGDLDAFEAIRDLIGEKVSKTEVSVQNNSNPYEGLTTEELKKLIGEE